MTPDGVSASQHFTNAIAEWGKAPYVAPSRGAIFREPFPAEIRRGGKPDVPLAIFWSGIWSLDREFAILSQAPLGLEAGPRHCGNWDEVRLILSCHLLLVYIQAVYTVSIQHSLSC